MLNNRSRLDWCLSNEDRLKKIPINHFKSKEHIEKAKHNLLAADYNIRGNFNDWALRPIMPCIMDCWLFYTSLDMNQKITNVQLVR